MSQRHMNDNEQSCTPYDRGRYTSNFTDRNVRKRSRPLTSYTPEELELLKEFIEFRDLPDNFDPDNRQDYRRLVIILEDIIKLASKENVIHLSNLSSDETS